MSTSNRRKLRLGDVKSLVQIHGAGKSYGGTHTQFHRLESRVSVTELCRRPLELRPLHSFSHCPCPSPGKQPFHQGARLCAHPPLCGRYPGGGYAEPSPIAGNKRAKMRTPSDNNSERRTKAALTSAKPGTLRDASEANSCFRSYLTGTCVFLCLANTLQAASRSDRTGIKTNTEQTSEPLPPSKTPGTPDGDVSHARSASICPSYLVLP